MPHMTYETMCEKHPPLDCDGYRSLLESVKRDFDKCRNLKEYGTPFHDYYGKMVWVLERAAHYAEQTGMSVEEILDGWEKQRDYWYMSYYQDLNQPEVTEGNDEIRIFDTTEELQESMGKQGFRCPACKGVSKSPFVCDSGEQIDKKVCDWKVYGLLTLPGTVAVFVKDAVRFGKLFRPLAWEKQEAPLT